MRRFSTKQIPNRERERAYARFMDSGTWRSIRRAKMESVEWLCESCPASRPRIATQVHHLNYARFGGDELSTDLQALCDQCHRRLHRVTKQQYGLWWSLQVNAAHAMTQFGVDTRARIIASYEHG